MRIYFSKDWDKSIFVQLAKGWDYPNRQIRDRDRSLLDYIFLIGGTICLIFFSIPFLVFELLDGVKIKRKP